MRHSWNRTSERGGGAARGGRAGRGGAAVRAYVLPDASEWEGWPKDVQVAETFESESIRESILGNGWDWFRGANEDGSVWAVRALSIHLGVCFTATECRPSARGPVVRIYVSGCGAATAASWARRWSWARFPVDDPRERWKLAEAAWRQVPEGYQANYPLRDVARDLDRFCDAVAELWATEHPADVSHPVPGHVPAVGGGVQVHQL